MNIKISNSVLIVIIIIVTSNLAIAQWVQTNNGLNGDEINCLTADLTNTYLLAGTEGDGAFISINNGDSWTAINNGLTNLLVYAFTMNDTYLFVGTDEGVSRSTDNGSNWTPVNNGLTNQFVQALVVNGTYLFAGTAGGGAFRSTNNGDSWEEVNNGLTRPVVIDFAISGTNLFAATVYGGVFLSTNNGNNWTEVNNGLTNYVILALCANDINIFAGTLEGVFHSTNNGSSWTQVGLLTYYVGAFATSGNNLFAGTEQNGVFLSSDNGGSWLDVNNGLTNYYVGALAISGTYLFAGTSGDGVWRRPLSEMITSVRETSGNELPSEYELVQNYPNPFNPSTKINYQIPELSFITIKVYDVLGNEITTLVNEEKPVGNYEVEFNASILPSGVYFYKLRAGNFVETKKMLLMK